MTETPARPDPAPETAQLILGKVLQILNDREGDAKLLNGPKLAL